MGVDIQSMARNIIREKYTMQESRNVAPVQQTISPSPFNIRSSLRQLMGDAIDSSGVDGGYRTGLENLAKGVDFAVDAVPLVGDAIAVQDTMDSYRRGDLVDTGINAAAAALGVIPVVGDAAGKAVKAGGNRVRSALHDIGETVPVEQRLKAAREKWESNSSDKGLRENYLNIRRERDSLGGSVDQVAPEAQPTIEDYRGSHQPPDREYGASLDDLSSMIPEDIYSPSGPRLYGLGDPSVDREAFASLNKARGNPRQEVPVYRAVPLNVDDINAGDWVTTSRRYAEMHGDNALGGEYKILEQNARAGDLQSEGYPYEFGFNPLDPSSKARMQRAEEGGFEEDIYYKGMYPYDYTKESGDYAGPEITEINRPSKFPAFNKGEEGVDIAGFMTTNKDVANRFSGMGNQGAVYPLRIREGRVFEIDGKGMPAADSQFFESGLPFREAVRSGKYDTIKINNTSDEGDIVIPLDPKNIRSINAEFDPAKADSSNLLSGISRSSLRDIA